MFQSVFYPIAGNARMNRSQIRDLCDLFDDASFHGVVSTDHLERGLLCRRLWALL